MANFELTGRKPVACALVGVTWGRITPPWQSWNLQGLGTSDSKACSKLDTGVEVWHSESLNCDCLSPSSVGMWRLETSVLQSDALSPSMQGLELGGFEVTRRQHRGLSC